ncbi:hypothetical protein SAMN02910456_00712 [Ruminococcaceae bacterium YRB3002]|nr:hypothetical protein SAMN02910456_00712 [Ruminococcaceae bacterium YRB3002]
MKQHRNVLISAIATVTVILAVLISSFLVLKDSNGGNEQQADLSSMTSEYAAFSGGTWTYGGGLPEGEDSIALIRGPYISLPAGTYTAHVSYSSTETDAIKLFSAAAPDSIVSSNVRLEPYLNGFDFDFELKEDISDLEFALIYTGGEVTLDGITVRMNNNNARRIVMTVDLLLTAGLIIFLLRGIISKDIKGALVILGTALLISVPLVFPELSHGHDLNFHAVRIEGIAQELEYGQFPVRMSSLWMGGYGYPVSIYYGDILLYFPAILRIFGFSINASYKIYLLAVNIMTSAVSYVCFKKIFSDFRITVITTLLYCTAAFRFVDCYVRTTAGEIAALGILPLIALAVYRIYRDDPGNSGYMTNSILLAAGMSGLILTHLITTELVVFILVITVLIMFRKTFRKKTLLCLVTAVFWSVLFTLSFTVPFFHYSSSVETYIQAWMKYDSGRNIQQVGASLYELIRFWGNWFGMGNDSSTRMSLTPGPLLLAGIILAIALMIIRKGNRKIYMLTGLSLLTLFLSSNLFPWDLLEALPMGETLVAIQFPWRYLGISIILLTLLAGEASDVLFRNNAKAAIPVTVAVTAAAVAISAVFTIHYRSEAYRSHFYDTHSLVIGNLEDAEYLMTGTDKSTLTYEPVIDSGTVEMTGREGTYMRIRTVTDKRASVSVPVFAYPNYEITGGGEITKGENNMITFEVPEGDNITEIRYKAPAFYRIAEAVSAISVAAAAVYCVRRSKISREGSV